MDAVLAGKRGEAEVGDDEPLGRQRVVIVVEVFQLLRLRHHDIDAGLEIADGLIDRKRGRGFGIEGRLRVDRETALPHRHAARILQLLNIGTAQAGLEIAVAETVGRDRVDQVAVADAVDFDGDGFGVDADDGNALLAGARQHIGRGRKAHGRLSVAHIDREIRRFRQRFVHHRRQTGAQRDLISLAMREALDAKLLLRDRQRRLVGAGERDEGREIGARRNVFGELETGARRRRVGIDGIIEHAETVLVAQPLILPAHIGDFAQFEREPQRIERRPPDLALAQQRAEKRETVGFLVAIGGALIGDVGRARRAFEQHRALVVVAGADLLDGVGETQPRAGVIGGSGNDLVEHRHAGAEIVLGECGVGVALELVDRLRRRPGVGLDLGLELDRAAGQIVVGEWLGRGSRGKASNGQAALRQPQPPGRREKTRPSEISSQERAKTDRGGIRPALKFEAKIVSRSWPKRRR